MNSEDPTDAATENSPLLRTVSQPKSSGSQSYRSKDADSPPPISRLRGSAIVVSFTILIFLQSSNFSIMSTTSTPIAAQLDSYAEVSWFTSTYLIAMSSMSPIFGRLAQIFSPRHCVFWGGVVFAIGSLVTSQADTLPVFLIGRAIAGMGAGGLLSLSIILVIYLTDKKRRGLWFGLANTAVTLGVSLGAVIGGAFVESIGWRPLFWLQSPLALLGAVGLLFSIPESDMAFASKSLKEKLGSIDYIGSLLLVSTLTSLLVGLASSRILVIPIAVSAVLLVLFVLNEIYLAPLPVLPISVLGSRGALLSCFSQLGLMTTRWAVLFYTPVYTLAVRGWSPATAGTILIPTNLGFAVGGLLVGWLHIRRSGSFYSATVICFALFPISVFIISYMTAPDSDPTLLMIVVFLNGFIVGASLNYCLAHLLHLTRPDVHFISTSLLATFRGFSGSFGSGIFGGVFSRILKTSLEDGFARKGINGTQDLERRLLGSPALVYQLEGDAHEVAVQGYSDALKGLFLAGSVLALVSIAVQAGTGWKGAEESVEGPDTESQAGEEETNQ